jgi:hypothetical protein
LTPEVFDVLKIVLGAIVGSIATIVTQRFQKTPLQLAEDGFLKEILAQKCTPEHSPPDDTVRKNAGLGSIAVDRLNSYEYRKSNSSNPLAFEDIRIDRTNCAWERLTKASPPDGYEPYFEDWERVKRLYHSASLAFEQRIDPERKLDPILDVTVRNTSRTGLYVTGLAVTALAAWSVPKQAKLPMVVRMTRTYDIKVDFMSEHSLLHFSPCFEIEPDSLWRFQIRLEDYHPAWNETLIALGVQCGRHGLCESEPIYLGTI